jgi:PAS domain S-box-containing protein
MRSSAYLEQRPLVSLTWQVRDFFPAFRSRLRDRRFWVVQGMVIGVTAAHFLIELLWMRPVDGFDPMYFVPAALYFFPVLYASLNFGREGAIPTALWSALLATPNVLIWHHGAERFGEAFQLGTVVVLATIVATRVDREIVARHRAEEKETLLYLSELKYHSIFDNAGQAIIVFDRQGIICEANEAAASLFLGAEHELKGKQVEDVVGMAGVASMGLPSTRERWLGGEFPLNRPTGDLWLEPMCTRLSETDEGLVVALFRDITSRRGLQSYAREIVRAQEGERQRIARDLHDISLQSIVLLCRRLDAVEEAGDGVVPVDVLDAVGRARDLAEEIAGELRRFSRDLRPSVLDDLGLVPAIRSLLSELKERSAIQVQFVAGGSQVRLPEDCEVTIFRISQECLRNVEKHSGATRVVVKLTVDTECVKLSVTDNGRGFKIPQSVSNLASGGRLGLLGMRERATLAGGTCAISSRPGKGTSVRVRLPAMNAFGNDAALTPAGQAIQTRSLGSGHAGR